MPSHPITPTQQHFLKRELLKVQIESEILQFNDPNSLRRFGYPFSPNDPSIHKKGESSNDQSGRLGINDEFVLTKYAFSNFLATFPFLSKDHQDWDELWVRKVQVLYEKFMHMDMSSTMDRDEVTKRRKMSRKLHSLLLVMFNCGIGTTDELEYYEHDKFEQVGEKITSERMKELLFPTNETLQKYLADGNFVNGLRLNVAGVRLVKKKNNKFLASLNLTKKHESYYEFIICTKMDLSESEDVYVSRRYSEFKHLHHQLKKKFPGKHLPTLPGKAKADISMRSNDNEFNDEAYGDEDDEDIEEERTKLREEERESKQHMEEVKRTLSNLMKELKIDESQINLSSATTSSKSVNGTLKNKRSPPMLSSPQKKPPVSRKANKETSNLPREKTRAALRSYLRSLLEDIEISQCEILKEFLNKGKILHLSNEEVIDLRIRENLDLLQLMNQVQFQKEAYKKIAELKKSSLPLRAKMLESDNGIIEIFTEFKTKRHINELSEALRNFITWSEIEMAATIYQLFLSNDNSAEFFSQIKRLHRLVPYSIMFQILKYTNPMLIMKAMIELLMSNPFGGRSLLQTVFHGILSDDIKHQEHMTLELESKITQSELLQRMKFFVFDCRDDKLTYNLKEEARQMGKDFLFVILTSPQLSHISVIDFETIEQMYESYNEFKSMEKIEKSQNKNEDLLFINHEKLELYSTLKQLFKLYVKTHDKSLLQQLWSEPDLISLLREIFTMFYQPLVNLFRNSHVEVAFKHFEKFMDDLIHVIESLQHTIYDNDISVVIDKIMGVLQRHEDSFYMFLHEVYSNDKEGVFDGIINWINSILNFLRKGKNKDVSLRIDFDKIFEENPDIDKDAVIKQTDKIITETKASRDKIKQKLERDANSKNGKNIIDQTWDQINANVEVFNAGDFGVNELDVLELNDNDDNEVEAEDETDLSGNSGYEKNSDEYSLLRNLSTPFKEQIVQILGSYS